jgi:aryl sulfotransferase
MHDETPPQGRDYRGPITDTTRWQSFSHRPDDIFICTPAKCGTTWTQAICAMLVFGRVDHGRRIGDISPWIDADFGPIEDYLREVDSQTHRRFLKTHTPLDGVPYHRECTYLVVLRDPRDLFFSGLSHRANMTDPSLAAAAFPGGEGAFERWLTEAHDANVWDFWTLDAVVHFYRSYWAYRHLPNVHLLHYTDMKRDLTTAVSGVADAIGATYSAAELSGFAEAASFDHMKKNAKQFAPNSGTGLWHSESKFFSRGALGQWVDDWSAEEIAAFDDRIETLLSEPERDWLLSGGDPVA